MIAFYIWLIGMPIAGIICSWYLSKEAVIRNEHIMGSMLLSVAWPIGLLGVGIAKLSLALQKWRRNRAK